MLNQLKQPGFHLIYGPGASGKTTISLQVALEICKKKKVLFVDTEKSFSIDRLKQMDPDCDKYLDNLMVIHTKDFQDQINRLNLIEELVNNKFGLVVVDSFTHHYRYEMQRNEYKDINMKAIQILRKLRHVSKNIPVLLTSQVYANVKDKSIVMVGGKMLQNFSDTVIELEKEPRKIIMKKPENSANLIEIKDEGVILTKDKKR